MGIAKVIVNGVTTMDVTQTTATADKILQGYGCIGADGEWIDGTATGGGTPALQSKTATPTKSQQTVTPDTGYDGLSQVTVNPIPSQYIVPTGTKSITENGTGIDVAQYASVDVAVESGPDVPTFSTSDFETVTCDKTYAECLALFNAKNHNALIAYSSETSSGTVEHLDNLVGYSMKEDTGILRYIAVMNGVPYWQIDFAPNGTISSHNPESVKSLAVTANGTYSSGRDKVWNEVTVNVPSTAPTLQSKSVSYTPSETARSATVTADSGYDGLSSVDVSVGAISSTYVGSGITRRSSTDLTASGATVTVPAGYYSAQASKAIGTGSITAPTITVNSETGEIEASTRVNQAGYLALNTTRSSSEQLSTQAAKTITPSTSQQTAVEAGKYTTGAVTVAAMPSGTAGTPTATKGTVSNHSVSVTPSVTNTTGYITGGTKSGTAVSVSASELVSGTYTVSASGTHDVTNYKSASVAAGGATASATKGTVSNHSVTVTPKVTRTAGYVTAGTANGTAVTVSASELVSGSQTITDNGTVNVTNLASVTVDIDFVTYHTSTSEPTSSQGSDGDIWLVTA